MTSEKILKLWFDQEKCPDFEPVLVNLLAELNVLRDAMEDISKSCPLLNKDKNAMHGPNATSIFAQSTTTRMEKAKKAILEAGKVWELQEVSATKT